MSRRSRGPKRWQCSDRAQAIAIYASFGVPREIARAELKRLDGLQRKWRSIAARWRRLGWEA